jgi:fructose-bisphosphate aldolase class II
MALISLRQLLDHAAENGYGVPSFNINNMEQLHAIMEAAEEAGSPALLQVSAGARKYARASFIRHMIEAALEDWPHLPICVHQDHGADPGVCNRSIQSGFTSVMMDGSLMPDMKTPSSYEYNVEVTTRVAETAHSCGVSVEGELGCLGSLETMKSDKGDAVTKDMLLTDPDQAADFVQRTKVDALAVAIGTSHGAYKFTKPPTGEVLAIDRIKAIHARIPNTHLVMHGSSSVPQEWVKIVNEFGGDLGTPYGVPVEEIVEGIKHGVRKVNIDTDLRIASTGAMRKLMAENRKEFDPRKIFAVATKAMKDICKARYEAFGSAGQASRIKVLNLEQMTARYAKGELDPIVK